MKEGVPGWKEAKLYVNETGSELPKGAKPPTLSVVPTVEVPPETAPHAEEAVGVPKDHCSYTYVTGSINMIEQLIQARGDRVAEKKGMLDAIRRRYVAGPDVDNTDPRNGITGLEAIEKAQNVLKS